MVYIVKNMSDVWFIAATVRVLHRMRAPLEIARASIVLTVLSYHFQVS